MTGSNASVVLQGDGASSVLSANNSFVAATGDDDIGALAQNGGAIGTRNETLTVDGNNPNGVQLTNSGVIEMDGGSVTTTGSGGQYIHGSLALAPTMGPFKGT